VARHQIPNDLYIFPIEEWFEIDGIEIATLLGEVSAIIKDIRDTSAHTGRKIPAARAKNQNQAIRHVFAPVVANPLNDGSRPGISDRKALPRHSIEERFATRRAVKSNVPDYDIFFGSKARGFGRIDNDAAAGQALANIVIGFSFESDGDSLRQKRP
jgi:hypothetical protein